METGRIFTEERRLVSVLFADIVGFTSFADHADVEVIGDLIRDIWQVLDRVIERQGGRIDKHSGDGVMAIWGAPIAKDDDAEQAVIAGLGLLQAFEQFATGSNMVEVQRLKLRVGINSGLVLSTYVGTHGEYTVIGDTVNVANRIENEAKPGTLWISEATYNLVKGAFEVKNIGPLKLRGKMEQTNIYQVLGINIQKRRERFISYGGLTSNLVGRERELRGLDRIYLEIQRSRRPKLVLFVGEAGIGKSRLMMEFTKKKEIAGEKLFLLSGRALSQTNKVPFYLWKSIFYNLFDIKEDDEPGTVKVKLTYRLRELLGNEREASDFNAIVDSFAVLWGLPKEDTGVDTEEYDLDASFDRIISLIKAWANRNPVIMIIDDIQWADTASIELITKIVADSHASFPLMIIGGARIEFLQTHKNLLTHAAVHQLKEIELSSSSIKTAYPDLQNYPEWVLDKIAVRSEGNPYFMEELTKSILASYSLENLEELSQSKNRRLTFPRSLRVSLQARIDSLTPESRGVLLVASVVGRTFWRGAVITAANTPIDTTRSLKVTTVDFIDKIDESFKELIRKELVFPKVGSYFSNETQYIFKHALLREVAYDLLPKKFRRQCHIAVANWLIERAGADFYYTIGEHYEKGNDLKNARTYYGLAAVRAQSRRAAEEYDSIMEKIQDVLK